jgi:hypothetical protein
VEPSAPDAPPSRTADWLVAGVFALALALPVIDRSFAIDPVSERQPGASQALADPFAPDLAPGVRIAALRERAALEFGFRNALVLAHGRASLGLFAKSANENVVIGRDGWLFLRAEDALDSHRNLRPFPPPLLDGLVASLDWQQRWLAERGIPYLLVLVPAKHSIYGEQLPDWAAPIRARSRSDELATRLAERTQVELLDLRETLRAAKRSEPVYHRTDTHWNAIGAYHGYRAVLERIGPALGLAALPRSAFRETSEAGFSGDLARMLGLRGVLRESERLLELRGPDRAVVVQTKQPAFAHQPRYLESFATRNTPPGRSDAPRALILRDSFGDALFPYLAQHFSHMAFAWADTFSIEALLPELVERGRPDVVVHIRVERSLMRLGVADAADNDS